MIEDKTIKRPRHAKGFTEFLTQVQEAILGGYRLPENISGQGKPSFGSHFMIRMQKETPDDPLEKLNVPTLKADALREIAKEDFDLEIPEDMKHPAAMKKFIKDSVQSKDNLPSKQEDV